MPTQDVLIPIRFDQGLDTKSDSKATIPGRLLSIENGVFTKGAIIEKRYGVSSLGNELLSTTTSITSGAAMNNFQSELLVHDGNRMYSRSETSDSLVDRGVSVSVQVSNKQIRGASNRDITRTTACINQGIGLYVWYDGTNLYATVTDEKSGTLLVVNQQIGAAFLQTGYFQLFKAGNYIYVVFASGGNLQVYQLAVLNPTSFTYIGALVTNLDISNPMFDLAEFRNGAICAYRQTGGQAALFYITNAGLFGSSTSGYPGLVPATIDTADNAIGVWTDGNSRIALGYHGPNGTTISTWEPTLSAPQVARIVDATTSPITTNITGYFLGNTVYTLYEQKSSVDVNTLTKTAALLLVSPYTLTTPGTVFKRSVGLASKAWVYNGQGYVVNVFNSANQSTYYVHSGQGTRVAKLIMNEAGSYGAQAFLSAVNVSSADPSTFVVSLLQKVQETSAPNGGLYFNRGVTRSAIAFGKNNAFQGAELGKNFHIIGGTLFNYDGKSLTEHGFCCYPEGQSLSSSISSSGGSIGTGAPNNTGIYTYYFTYRYVDNQGQLHESAPSFPQQVGLTGSSNKVTWTIPTLRITDKVSGSIGVYRTTQNTSTAYMLTALSGVLNDTSLDTVTYVDIASDTAIQSNALLYTAGGVLENDAPPAPEATTTNKNRLWIIPSENPLELWYSKEWVKTNGVAFSLNLTLRLDPFGGPATALASLQNQLIIFKASSIYILPGDGPDATGQNNDFGIPQLLSADVGCLNPASICVTSLGVFFQSAKGIYLLNPGLNVGYVGAAVEAYNSYTVTSATVLSDVNQVRFTLSGGPTLVYFYEFGQWGVFTGTHNGLADAAIYNDSYVMLSPVGNIYREDESTYQDNNRNVQLVLETAWIKLDPRILQGFIRAKKVHLLGTLGSQHTLFVQISYDYNDAVTQTLQFNTANSLNTSTWGSSPTWGSGALWGSDNGASDPVYQWRDSLEQQKCQALKFKMYDTYSGSLGQGYSINELLLTIGQKKGAYKLVGSKTI